MNDLYSVNPHLKSYLDFYFNTKNPGHAIMINGGWGSGKTHYINNFIKCGLKDEADNVVFISLNGLSAVGQINEYFLSSMIPFLKLKPNGFLVRLVGFSRKKFLVDSDELIGGLATLLSGKKIYIFDDVERYAGDYSELFGFVSSLVESKGARVLLVANEKELIRSVGKGMYKDKKEKFLGRVIYLQPDFDNAFDGFCFLIFDERERRVVEKRKEMIKLIYEKSSSYNLRVLKQGLIELGQVFSCFKDDWLERDRSIDFFVATFMCLFIENSLGRLVEDELIDDEFDLFLEDKDIKGFPALENKYSGVELRTSMLKNGFWVDVVFKGLVSKNYIYKAISKNPYFSEDVGDQEWVVLWRWSDFREEVYLKALNDFEMRFKNRGFLDLGEVFMAFGLMLRMEEMPYGKFTLKEAMKECKSYLVDYFNKKQYDDIYSANEVNFYYKSDLRYLISESYGHYGFPKRDSKEFNCLLEISNDMLQESLEKVLPIKAKELLVIMVSDPEVFYTKICSTHPSHNPYDKVPVLFYFDISEFVAGLFKLSGSGLTTVLSGISTRWTLNPEIAEQEKASFFNLSKYVDDASCKYKEFAALAVKKKIKDHMSKHYLDKD